MPYFAARGYDTYAVSLRAQGGSDPAPAGVSVAGGELGATGEAGLHTRNETPCGLLFAIHCGVFLRNGRPRASRRGHARILMAWCLASPLVQPYTPTAQAHQPHLPPSSTQSHILSRALPGLAHAHNHTHARAGVRIRAHGVFSRPLCVKILIHTHTHTLVLFNTYTNVHRHAGRARSRPGQPGPGRGRQQWRRRGTGDAGPLLWRTDRAEVSSRRGVRRDDGVRREEGEVDTRSNKTGGRSKGCRSQEVQGGGSLRANRKTYTCPCTVCTACRYVLGSAKPGTAASTAPGSFAPLSGAGFLCSVPQSGNKQMVTRFLFRDPILSLKLTWWVA